MKQQFLLIILLIPILVNGQDTTYLNYEYKRTDRLDAKYYRIVETTESSEISYMYYVDGKLRSVKNCSKSEDRILDELYTYYYII